jgi:hypothetical protein
MNRQSKMIQKDKNLPRKIIESAMHRTMFFLRADLRFQRGRKADSKNTLGGTICLVFNPPLKSDNILRLLP